MRTQKPPTKVGGFFSPKTCLWHVLGEDNPLLNRFRLAMRIHMCMRCTKRTVNKLRLFHVSEELDIQVFHPRFPKRNDLYPTIGLVWAIDEEHFPNFLVPRDCPRVTYHVSPQTNSEDINRFFSSYGAYHAVVLENGWYHSIINTVLYLYEFEPNDFECEYS